MVVLNAGALKFGLVVEELHDTTEIVVKPLGRHFKGLREYAGATVLGDGSLALILDVGSIVDMAGITSQEGSSRAAQLAAESVHDLGRDRHTFLLFNNAPEEWCAVPLEQVARVEKVERDQIEQAGGKRTMQYRGGSLPLVSLQDKASVRALEEGQELVVIVFEAGQREMGLLGALPIDSVEVEVQVDQRTHRQPGVAGSAIIKGITTLILDVHELVDQPRPPAAAPGEPETPVPATGGTLLLAEDSDFFRNQVRRFLEGDGYRVIAAEDGEAAWEKLLANAETIVGVVSDIEMPRLNGFQLVQRIRSDPRFAALPVIAVTSLAGEDDVEKGKSMGFTEYQVKLDKVRLLEALHRLLGRARDDA